EFTSGRCLIIADGFYEFTTHTDPKSKRKHKWLFTKTDEPWFCIAGIWRDTGVGEAFTMLPPSPALLRNRPGAAGPQPRGTPTFSALQSRMCQHVPATTRRFHHMPRTAIVLGILEA